MEMGQVLLKIVDHLQEVWLENQALWILLERSRHLDFPVVQQLFKSHIENPANQHLARQHFAPLRDAIQDAHSQEELLEILKKLPQQKPKETQ